MKPDDIPFTLRHIENEMSIHSPDSAKIPYSFKPMPKNLMEESHKVQNKFLNKYLAEIEEANHCKILSPKILQFFLHQNKKYHTESGILNHDGFFNIDPYGVPMPKGTFYGNRGNAFISFGGIPNGATFEVGSDVGTNNAQGAIVATRVTAVGVVPSLYDQLALSIQTANSTYRLACYDDDADDPDALLASTGAIANSTGFNWESVTEFELTTAKTWFSQQQANGIMKYYYVNDSNSFTGYRIFSYADSPDPWGTMAVTPFITAHCKIGHT